jgi:hypothetical protein
MGQIRDVSGDHSKSKNPARWTVTTECGRAASNSIFSAGIATYTQAKSTLTSMSEDSMPRSRALNDEKKS